MGCGCETVPPTVLRITKRFEECSYISFVLPLSVTEIRFHKERTKNVQQYCAQYHARLLKCISYNKSNSSVTHDLRNKVTCPNQRLSVTGSVEHFDQEVTTDKKCKTFVFVMLLYHLCRRFSSTRQKVFSFLLLIILSRQPPWALC